MDMPMEGDQSSHSRATILLVHTNAFIFKLYKMALNYEVATCCFSVCVVLRLVGQIMGCTSGMSYLSSSGLMFFPVD